MSWTVLLLVGSLATIALLLLPPVTLALLLRKLAERPRGLTLVRPAAGQPAAAQPLLAAGAGSSSGGRNAA